MSSSASSSAESTEDSTYEDTKEVIQRQNLTRQDIFDAAARNDMEAVKHFVEVKDVPPRAMNADDQTAAHIAAKNRNLEIFQYLVNKDRRILSVKDKWDQSCLHQASASGALEIVKYLVQQCKANPFLTKGEVFGDTCLHIAAYNGHLDLLKFYVSEVKMDPNMRNTLGEPPLFLAADKQHLHCVKYLYEVSGADPTQVDNNQRNILYPCAQKGNITIPKYLLEEKNVPIDINWQDVFGQTVLYTATRFNQLKFIKYVIEERNADVNIASKNGVTPIQEAATEGHVDIVKYLHKKGADVTTKDKEGNTIRKVAKRKEVKEYLDSIFTPQNSTRRRRDLHSIELGRPLSSVDLLGNATNSNPVAAARIGKEDLFHNSGSHQTPNWLAFMDVFVTRFAKHRPLLSVPEILADDVDQNAIQAVYEYQE